jgi:hypothetical protein
MGNYKTLFFIKTSTITMKLAYTLPIIFGLWSPAQACLVVTGEISGGNAVGSVIDNGGVVCSGVANTDSDGHFSLPCRSGYVYSFTKDGKTAW